MSLTIHNMILQPGDTLNYICTDGLSTTDILNIENLFNFGGNIVPQNCGTSQEFLIIDKALRDMKTRYYAELADRHSIQVFADFQTAFRLNLTKMFEF